MLACNCLNVIIEVLTNDFQKVNADSLNLTEDELNDEFFHQNIQQVGKLININKVHSGLIKTKNVGDWIVHYCINCNVYSHAVHRDKGAACVLVNSNLLTNEQINKLKLSEHFSPFFNIIINTDKIDADKTSHLYISNEIEPILKGLKQLASEALKQETALVEERIKKFTEEQYNLLDNSRERAFREQQALIGIILMNNSLEDPLLEENTYSKISSTKEMPSILNKSLNINIDRNIANGKMKKPERHTPKRQKSSPTGPINTFDTDNLLFEFDRVDDIQSQTSETDNSDNDELNIEDNKLSNKNRQDNKGKIIAKSLPMNIPVFMNQNKNHINDDDDLLPVDENVDIAASIKALAKSVHGDTVFGDLPRPRFSTQI